MANNNPCINNSIDITYIPSRSCDTPSPSMEGCYGGLQSISRNFIIGKLSSNLCKLPSTPSSATSSSSAAAAAASLLPTYHQLKSHQRWTPAVRLLETYPPSVVYLPVLHCSCCCCLEEGPVLTLSLRKRGRYKQINIPLSLCSNLKYFPLQIPCINDLHECPINHH